MPLNHVVILSFARIPTATEREALLDASKGMCEHISAIRSLECGFDAGITGEAYVTYSLVVKFDCESDYLAYANHPIHRKFIATHIKPLLAEDGRRAIQFYT